MANCVAQAGIDQHDRSAMKLFKYLLYTGPVSYTTFGDTFAPADVGLGKIDFINPIGNAYSKANTTMYLLSWDQNSQTVVWYVPNTGAEVANGTNLSAYTVLIEAVGH